MSVINRYRNRNIFLNDDRSYKSFFDKRDVTKIEHYDTALLDYPTDEEIRNFNLITY